MKKILILCCLVLVTVSSCRKTDTSPGRSSYDLQSLGSSAHDILSAGKYTGLDIEIQYMPGYQAEAEAIANLKAYLEMLCNKPAGITVTQKQIAPYGDTLDPTKVSNIEKENRTIYTSGSRIGIYIVITNAVDTSLSTLGFAYRNTSICLFGKTIATYSGKTGYLSRMALESGVLEHEMGHILGLANIGSPMVSDHEDDDHSKHCSNKACLMYYAIDLNSPANIANPNRIPTLDDNCRADLKANGGK